MTSDVGCQTLLEKADAQVTDVGLSGLNDAVCQWDQTWFRQEMFSQFAIALEVNKYKNRHNTHFAKLTTLQAAVK